MSKVETVWAWCQILLRRGRWFLVGVLLGGIPFRVLEKHLGWRADSGALLTRMMLVCCMVARVMACGAARNQTMDLLGEYELLQRVVWRQSL